MKLSTVHACSRRASESAQNPGVPLTLHGGSGTSDEHFQVRRYALESISSKTILTDAMPSREGVAACLRWTPPPLSRLLCAGARRLRVSPDKIQAFSQSPVSLNFVPRCFPQVRSCSRRIVRKWV